MDFGGAKRPRSKTFGKDIHLPKETPGRTTRPVPPTTPMKKSVGATKRIGSAMSRLKGNR